jgi:hypothetical protein
VYDLRSLILAYEQWAHNLLPDLEFKLFAKRAQKLGGNARIKVAYQLASIIVFVALFLSTDKTSGYKT